MELQHVNVKIFAEHPERFEPEKLTPIFQRWIQEQNSDELLIDVADYLHVDAGPGIVLIGNEADYSMDQSGHRLGLRYNRKAFFPGNNQDRLRQAFRAAISACRRLEKDPLMEGKLHFHRQEVELFINDRALAPNSKETYEACKGDLERFFQDLLNGGSFTMDYNADPRVRFGVNVRTSKDLNFDSLMEKR